MSLDSMGGTHGVLEALVEGYDLSADQARSVLSHVFAGETDPSVVAGLLVAWRAKGETAEEMHGMVEAMLEHCVRVELDRPAMDIVGTGGDQKHSVNVSTMAALCVAGAGVAVCKHGNRAASSSVGTADVLEELGVTLEVGPEVVARSVREAGIGFCFAPAFHPAMRFVGPVRRALGIRTVFNVLGPLANPARPSRLLVGTADPDSAEKMAAVLGASGVERAWVVHAHDGFDELSLATTSSVVEVVGDGSGSFEMRNWILDPSSLGLRNATEDDVRGGDVATNADVVRRVLDGEQGPARDLVVLNAAAALVVADRAEGIEDGVVAAAASLDSGAATRSLDQLIAATTPD